MADKIQENDFTCLVDPDASCKFVHPVDRSYSQSFQCRSAIYLLDGIWWFGISEIAISSDQLERFRQQSIKEKLLTFIVRIETKDFSGFANVIRTVVQDEVISIFFNGLTAVGTAC